MVERFDKGAMERRRQMFAGIEAGDIGAVNDYIRSNQNIDVRDNNNWTPLMRAVRQNQSTIVRLILSVNADMHASDFNGIQSIHIAVKNGNMEILQLLIATGSRVNARTKNGQTPLYIAVTQRNMKIAAYLIEYKADVNIPDTSGNTPYITAAKNGDKYMMKLLIDAGANPTVENWMKQGALYLAAMPVRNQVLQDIENYLKKHSAKKKQTV